MEKEDKANTKVDETNEEGGAKEEKIMEKDIKEEDVKEKEAKKEEAKKEEAKEKEDKDIKEEDIKKGEEDKEKEVKKEDSKEKEVKEEESKEKEAKAEDTKEAKEEKKEEQPKRSPMKIRVDRVHRAVLNIAKKHSLLLGHIWYDTKFAKGGDEWFAYISLITVVVFYKYNYQEGNQSYEAYDIEMKERFKDRVDICLIYVPNFKGMKVPRVEQALVMMGMRSRRKPVYTRKGDYTMMFFWGCDYSGGVENLKLIDKLVESHPEWLGKVRFMSFSLDNELDVATKYTKDLNWGKVDYYWVNEWGKKGIWMDILKKKHGLYVLVNRDGIIEVAGSPEWIDIEETMKAWLDDEVDPIRYHLQWGDKHYKGCSLLEPETTFEELSDLVLKFSKENGEDLDILYEPSTSLTMYRVVDMDRNYKNYAKVRLSYKWIEKHKELNDKLIKKANETFSHKVRVEENNRLIYLNKFNIGTKCKKCEKSIEGCEQYMSLYSYKSFCVECIKPRFEIKCEADLEKSHKYPLAFLQKDSWKVVDEIRINRIEVCELEEFGQKYTITCSGCGMEGEVSTCWKCANCGFKDFCTECFRILRDPDDPKYNELAKKCAKERHDVRTHIYILQDEGTQLEYHYYSDVM